MNDEFTQEEALVRLWKKRLQKEKACDSHEKFRKQAKEAAEAALDEGGENSYNIQWANNKIIRSAIYATRPKPDVRRRYVKQVNPDEKNLALMVERALEFYMDTDDWEAASRAVVKDFVDVAAGIPRVIYDADLAPQKLSEDTLAMFAEPPMEVVKQNVGIEHIPWKRFRWEPGNTEWRDVGWVAFEYFDSAKNVRDHYGVYVKPGQESTEKKRGNSYQDEVQYFEIWDKPNRRVITIATNHPEPLDVAEDPLGLKGFYPCPRPAFDNLRSDELVPKPDYELVKKRINELNRLTKRRAGLVQKVKPQRFIDASLKKDLQTAQLKEDAASIPIKNMPERLGGDLSNMIAELPLADYVATIRELDGQIESVKNQIYEVSGISDIVRGASEASETATAQQIKGQWANVRLQDKTAEVNRMWRDVLRMMAEIICEQGNPVQLEMMTGIPVTPGMLQMMKNDIGRTFAIDIETDSTVVKDDQEERAQKMELVNIILEKMQTTLPLVQQGLMAPEFAVELLSFAISQYKNSKQLDDAIQGIVPHIQGLQDFQGQMQQMQMQLEQSMGENQQLGAMLKDAQQQLGQVNEREEARKDAELQIQGMDKEAETRLDHARAAEIEQRTANPLMQVV